MLIPVVENENSKTTKAYTNILSKPYRPIYITHVPSLSSLLSYLQLQGQLLWLAVVMTRPPPKTISTPHCPHTKCLSIHLLTISLPLPLLVNSNCNLSIITHPIVTSHFQISNNFTSESYLSRCYLTQQQLLYCHSPHCHPSLLVLILSNLILQNNIQIFTLSLMCFIPKKNELNKWKNHFVEMKGDVGM